MESGEFIIELSNLTFFARHGVYDFERKQGNDFRVDLIVKYKAVEDSIENDALHDTVCYAELYKIVEAEMSTPRKLLETVAYTISKKIMNQYKTIHYINCKVTKLNPPIEGCNGAAAVSYQIQFLENKD